MTPQEARKLPKYTPNPIFADLPAKLKDPRNYEKVQRRLLETLATTHSHTDVEEWGRCFDCQKKVIDHKNMMQQLGFTSPAQYMAWKKTMDVIINHKRNPLGAFYDPTSKPPESN
jgi:hypothetical protein